jgi:DNA-binding PadR family transcriptional regulator
VTRSRALSPHARSLLAILAGAGPLWSHGYELCRHAGIKSGTLYPLLIRLEAQGYLEAEWQEAVESGRPPRHAYRLTAAGRELAHANPSLASDGKAAGLRGEFA